MVGFLHAFEADHIVAVSNLVTRRSSTKLAIKDGAFWGLGHSSIILIVGLIFLLGKFLLDETLFGYFEVIVGLMLIILGIIRLRKVIIDNNSPTHHHDHKVAYGVGAVHGLAGSGAVIIAALSETKSPNEGIIYLILFGIGSILGMMLAAGVFSLPFSTFFLKNKNITKALSLLSALLCIGLGSFIIYENLI
ncbi:urease accessory protein [Jiulongibacter sediminis]|nr:urease accessory protein [Jiulongibacter sediminis]